MEERRRHKRLPLEVTVELERLEQDSIVTAKYVTVEVFDLSKSGIGFISPEKMELRSYFDAKIKIWTGETLEVIINTVRELPLEKGYQYGGTFVGMTAVDALKLDIYHMLQEQGKQETTA
jgi:hypothetical protein